MRTEISAKFAPDSTAGMFEQAGLALREFYTDDRRLFEQALGATEV